MGKKTEVMKWLTKHWKVMAAVTYLVICLFDFIVIPTIISYWKLHHIRDLVNTVIKMNSGPEILRFLENQSRPVSEWIPFTLRGGGLFHISFGAILTGSIFGKNKGQE